MAEPLWKTVWQFLIKLNMQLPYNQQLHSGASIYPREMHIYAHTKSITQLFTGALCT